MADGHQSKALVPVVTGIVGLSAAAATVTAVLTASAARLVVVPARRFRYDIRIHSVSSDRSTITLDATPDALVPGQYSFWYSNESGHLRLGDIVASTNTTVTRRIDELTFGDVLHASRGRIAGWYYLRPEELGHPVKSVDIATDRGSAPAWLFPGRRRSGRWVIHVHGRGTRRQECLRAIDSFRDAGYTNLIVSYRNDGDAPNSVDGRYGLGSTEWHDVDAAVGFAVAHGAREIVLAGWSMGGAIVLQTATRSAHASAIRGLVLDSPVVDWVDTLQYQAGLLRLPTMVTRAALDTLAAPWGGRVTGLAAPIDLAVMDFVARADALTVPVLLMHSDDDRFVPPVASRALAQARPDIVTYIPFQTARHTKLWNFDPERWNQAVGDWLTALAKKR
jgi:alpha-beta hydrolase superfamily lysophospholipase